MKLQIPSDQEWRKHQHHGLQCESQLLTHTHFATAISLSRSPKSNVELFLLDCTQLAGGQLIEFAANLRAFFREPPETRQVARTRSA